MVEQGYTLRIEGEPEYDIPAEFMEKVLENVKITHPGTHFSVDAAIQVGNWRLHDGYVTYFGDGFRRIIELGILWWGLNNGFIPAGITIGRVCYHDTCVNPYHYMVKPSSAAENFSPSPLNLSQMEKGKFVKLDVKQEDSEIFLTLKDGTTIEIRQPA